MEEDPPAATMGDSPRWRSWKGWAAVSMVELAVILILAAGLVHFVSLPGARRPDPESWPDRGLLTSLDRVNQSLQDATKKWGLCQNHTRMLEANASNLSLALAQLSSRMRFKELENQVLQAEVALLKNWTEKLHDLNNWQKEIFGHFDRQSSRGDLRPRGATPLLVLLSLAWLLWV